MKKSIPVMAIWVVVSMATIADGATTPANTPAGPTTSASFDCRKASTATEQTICGDAALMTQDRAMSTLYTKLQKQLPTAERDRLQGEQRAWLKEVRDRCADAACIGQSYRTRTAALRTALRSRPNAIKQVALGQYHSCTLTMSGAVSCRGHNQSGQVGNGKLNEKIARPARVVAQGATQIATGDSHSCAVVKGALLCWGNNYYATVGNGQSGEGSNVPKPIQVIASGVRSVSAGKNHGCAVVNESLWCWGSNQHNQLGRGAQASIVLQPTEIISGGITGVAAGENHTCAIVRGALQCWGYNSNGQIGNGASGGHVPDPVTVIPKGVTAVAAGSDHTCAIADGALYCWGSNSSGEVGNGKRGGDVLTPELVIERGVTSIVTAHSTGDVHTCAIAEEALYCWGSNFYGQIGNAPPGRNVRAPVKAIESGVTAVAANGHHTCAVVDGAEQCWRYDIYGEIDSNPPAAARIRPAPRPASSNPLARYTGNFKGSLISSGTEFVETRLVLNSKGVLSGDYTMIPYEGSSGKDESGTLNDCKALPDREFLCQWRDQYGTGSLAIQFNADATEFRGSWRSAGFGREPRMKREYWLDKTGWNGTRQ